jgi:hypothetical protein
MTTSTSARIAGVTYLFYTAIGIGSEMLMHQARGGGSGTEMIASIGAHATDVRLTIFIVVLEAFSALVLAVTLYGITRAVDHELATLGLVCRTAEGILGTLSIPGYAGLLWLANEGVGAGIPDVATMNALRGFLLMPGPSVPIGSIFYALGSTLFCYLFLRGRMVPVAIAGLGVFASALLVVTLPLQLAGFSTGPLRGYYQWLPALAFQLVLAGWLLIKGVAPPSGLSRER